MDHIANFEYIVKNVFKKDFSLPKKIPSNNCTGALNNPDNFNTFKENFVDRLIRLNSFFEGDEQAIDSLLITLKEMAIKQGYKWSGGYSELVALDFWTQFENIEDLTYVDKGNVSQYGNSIAQKIGQQEIDLDISLKLSYSKIFMDVKSLIPTHLELVDRILSILQKQTGRDDYLIGIDDLFSVDYLQTKKDYENELRNGNLLDELIKCIDANSLHYSHTLQSGSTAKFRIAYTKDKGNTILSTMRSMEPYRLASDYKYKPLGYYNKLFYDKPSFLVFVANPWFNQEMSDFIGFNDVFYRSLARRTFVELTQNNDDMGNYYPDLAGKGLKIMDVAKCITGLIFIDDHSIMEKGNDIYKVRIYLNPNAINKRMGKYDFDILRWSHSKIQPLVIEDFQYDNY